MTTTRREETRDALWWKRRREQVALREQTAEGHLHEPCDGQAS